MPRLTDYVSVADAFVAFEEDLDGTFVPLASNSLVGSGIYDEEEAICRLAGPLDMEPFQSIQPPSSWEDLSRVLNEILENIKAQEVTLPDFPGPEWKTIVENPGAWAEAAGMAYSNYIDAQFEGYIDLVSTAIPTLIKANLCQVNVLQYSLEAMIDFLFDADGQYTIETAKNKLSNRIAQNPNCEVLLGVLDALMALNDAILWLKNQSLSGLWEEIGHVALIAAEILRDVEIRKKIQEIQGDPVKLGKVHGTLIGVIIWEVIEAVGTAGMGKGLRFLQVVR